jgi:C4-dicarboxylate-specific signal transduction histidine kinase
MRFTLRHRVLIILAGFVLISFLLGLVLVRYTFRIEGLIASITEKDLSAFHQAEALENTLMKQKGLVSYFILDGNPGWLHQQEDLRSGFLDQLARIRAASETPIQSKILDEIDVEYEHYTTKKGNVVELFRSGNPAGGAVEHLDAHVHFESLMRLCERFKQFHTDRIQAAKADSHAQAQRLRVLALAAIFISAGLTLLLAFVFVYQILEPLRRLTLEADRNGEPARAEDEVKTLSRRVRVLLHHVDHTQSELEKSRTSLAQAEKMALVGKLAASMAHSIRNPFTSVQMRLFSLSRSLDLDDVQKEDLEVISSEIRHIDTIVQNFLSFRARPS